MVEQPSRDFLSHAGLDATAAALGYGWEHWKRLQEMENPAGYLYRVGQAHASRRDEAVVLPEPTAESAPWVEPGLPAALEKLTEAQRTAVLLVHTFGHTLSEAADMLGVTKRTVQTHPVTQSSKNPAPRGDPKLFAVAPLHYLA